jgi:hypothetical protein
MRVRVLCMPSVCLHTKRILLLPSKLSHVLPCVFLQPALFVLPASPPPPQITLPSRLSNQANALSNSKAHSLFHYPEKHFLSKLHGVKQLPMLPPFHFQSSFLSVYHHFSAVTPCLSLLCLPCLSANVPSSFSLSGGRILGRKWGKSIKSFIFLLAILSHLY